MHKLFDGDLAGLIPSSVVAWRSLRTGVLIMVSLLEHQIYVLADQSIFQRVPSERWSSVVEAAVGRLKRGDIIGGLCQGIQVCGTLLAEVCPGRSGDNPDELSNELVVES